MPEAPALLVDQPHHAADKIVIPMIQGAPATATPAALKEVLGHMRVFTDSVNGIETNAHIAGDIEGPAHQQFRESIQRWYDLLDYYQAQVDAADPGDYTAVAKTVYGPLILGSCYGPPSCSQAAADSWAPGGFPISPTLVQPFILLSMIGAAEEAEEQNKITTAVGETIGGYVKEVIEGGKEVVEAAVGAVFPGGLPDFGLGIPPWVWPLAALAGGAMIYTAVKD